MALSYSTSNDSLSEFHDTDIIIAVRNEEKCILSLLDSLANQNYPKEKIHIYIGDDDSSDKTWALINSYPRYKLELQVFKIPQNRHVPGKAGVLDFLIKKGNSPFILITDGDIKTQPNWIRSLISKAILDGVDTVSSVTVCGDYSFQDLDWRLYCTMLAGFVKLGWPGSGVGNNMLITRSAYNKIGGYEKIPFSIVEDYALYKELLKNGFSASQLYNSTSLNFTPPVNSFIELLNQRKRWSIGALSFPLSWIILFFIVGIQPWVLLFGILFFPTCTISLLAVKIAFQTGIQWLIAKKLNLPLSWKSVLFYDLYNQPFSLILSMYLLIPGVKWKNRKY